MYQDGKLFIFVLQDKMTNEIHGLCETKESACIHIEKLKNLGIAEPKINAYRVQCDQ